MVIDKFQFIFDKLGFSYKIRNKSLNKIKRDKKKLLLSYFIIKKKEMYIICFYLHCLMYSICY